MVVCKYEFKWNNFIDNGINIIYSIIHRKFIELVGIENYILILKSYLIENKKEI